MDTIRRPTDVSKRRTKIVCTMGPACWSEEGLSTLMDAGMNVARFNFSHGSQEGHFEVLDRLRKVAGRKTRNIGRYFCVDLFLLFFVFTGFSTICACAVKAPLKGILALTTLSIPQPCFWIPRDLKFALDSLKKASTR